MKILLVEDERDILNGLAGALEAHDPSFSIYCANGSVGAGVSFCSVVSRSVIFTLL
jgi:DNA-binding response OmpR family regulator